MIKGFFIVGCILFFNFCIAQQYPFWTQYNSSQTLFNPGFCGTKRLVDFRLNYRNQWTGFDGAPKTYAMALHTRFLKGKLGLGGILFEDEIGPFKNTFSALTFAYHIKFPDSELSFGLQGNYMKQKFNGVGMLLRNQQDPSINQYIEDKAATFDFSFGAVYYNDRFHLGIGINNIKRSEFEYYKNDSTRKSTFVNVSHFMFSAGYNWAEDPDYVFENSLYASYVYNLPFALDYTLRFHLKKQLITGLSFRMKDAIVLHLGYTIKRDFQISYSYDLITSPLRTYQRGSHEIKFVFSSDLGTDKKKHGLNNKFIKQKFQYLL